MKRTNRFISLLLAIIMVVSMIPSSAITALAAGIFNATITGKIIDNESKGLANVSVLVYDLTEEELVENNINVVIYANQMLRAAYPSMVNVAKSILTHHRAKEASEEYCMSIREIINLIPGGKVIERK